MFVQSVNRYFESRMSCLTYEDVEVIVQKYVDTTNDPGLTAALEEVKRQIEDGSSSDEE